MNLRYLAASLLLLLANGFFVAVEFALIAARRTKLEELEAKGDLRARLAMASERELSFMLAGAQLGITAASLGLGYVAEPAVARGIESLLGRIDMPQTLLHPVSFVVALTIVVFFHMVVGEMAPKNIAIAEPERSALWLALPARAYANVFRPFIHLLNALANSGLRLLGIEPRDEVIGSATAAELARMARESRRQGLLGRLEQRLLSGAAALGERDAGSVMVPRTEMTAVPITATPAEIERVVLESGHSRLPVYAGDLDHVVGFFHAKDLLRIAPEERDRPLPRRYIRRLLVVPEARKLYPLLFDMKRERTHLALVVDEHGGTAGVVTIEDLLEELVGEIRDEYDFSELGVEQLGEGRWLVPGTLRIDEAEELLGADLPEGDYETVAGLVMERLGRVPKRRDAVSVDGWIFRVRTMHRRRVVQLIVERADPH
jgi:CBS domain containing-hemolysin-like protein